ncbi:nicotinamidase-related amidase [Ereboglobus sp. PH5-5]|uniref:isochorismatase family protein n=1 Tax=Ereboglobus sp. PH5-5 TaxID=2940529 RepID=UPI002407331C|nr:isochorismatase family protein [Ereboglobus sp. PH5-5]MDF9832787.1 nicotinamidase-related amidase [Ereboglobus sp. PH5-5]
MSSPIPGALLLCIDLQDIFLKAMPDAGRLSSRCEFAIEAARLLGIPVAFTEQVPQKLGPTAPQFLKAAAGGTRRKPMQLAKNTFSALADDGIRETLLEKHKVEHLILCGIETPICVYQTALDAINSDLQVTLLTDCLGARRPDDSRDALNALIRLGVYALPSETIFYSVVGTTEHPAFKDYTKLVKKYST